jgi:hypothetical protein
MGEYLWEGRVNEVMKVREDTQNRTMDPLAIALSRAGRER